MYTFKAHSSFQTIFSKTEFIGDFSELLHIMRLGIYYNVVKLYMILTIRVYKR